MSQVFDDDKYHGKDHHQEEYNQCERGAEKKDRRGFRVKSTQPHEFMSYIGGLGAEGPPELKPDHGRCIIHFDIDCFYAQVEEVLNPSLRGKPIGIQQKYLMVTCNYVARHLGVRKMKSVTEAKKRCPSLIMLDGEDLTYYREASEAIFSYVSSKLGPLVQRLGMDEIFADVTEIIDMALERAPAEVFVMAAEAVTSRTRESGKDSMLRRGVDSAEEIQDMSPSSSHRRMPEFSGHIYAPGSGGTLLEAQTGLEITLRTGGSSSGDDNVNGKINRDRDRNESCTREMNLPNRGGKALPTSVPDADKKCGNPPQDRAVLCRDISGGIPVAGGDTVALTSPGGVTLSAGARVGIDLRGEGVGGGPCGCGCVRRLAATSMLAARVREGLLETVGYTCSAGIGCSKAAAKLAGELHKPAQQTTILPEHAMSMILQLPVRKLPGCGHSTCAKLKTELGITETRQLCDCPWPLLVRAVGLKLAKILFFLCRGEDGTVVVPSVRPKTMSDEDSFKRGTIRSRDQVELHMRRLAAALLLRAGERARVHKETPEILRVSFRRASKGYGSRVSRQCAISGGFAAAWGAADDVVSKTRLRFHMRSSESGLMSMAFAQPRASAKSICNGAAVEGLNEEVAAPLPDDRPATANICVATTGQENRGPVDSDRQREHVRNGVLVDATADKSLRAEKDPAARETWAAIPTTCCSPSASPAVPKPRLTGSTNSAAVRGAPSAQRRESTADEALSEVVRLAMAVFDKMCSPREKLDVTLLSVGLAGFRSLGGASQSGITRFLAPQPQTSQTHDDTNCSPSSGTVVSSLRALPGRDSTPSTARNDTSTASNDSAWQPSRGDHRQAETRASGLSHAESNPNPGELKRNSRLSADRASPTRTNEDRGEAIGTCRDRGGRSVAETSITKRQRVELKLKENIYRYQSHRRNRAAEAVSITEPGEDTPEKGGEGCAMRNEGKEDSLADVVGAANGASSKDGDNGYDWEGAEVLVVEENGRAVRGKGRLDWCQPCRAHVLRSDMKEHSESAFHRARVRN